MILLQPENYDRVKPLLANLNHQTVIMTTLSGATPGKIYVDKPHNPGFAFVQFKHRAFFAGDMKSLRIIELENFIDDIVLDNCRIWDVPLIRLSAETEAGINDLQDLLQERQPIKVSYLCYQFDLSFPAPVVEIPEGFSIQQINSVLMESEFEDKVELLDEMCSERESVEAFLEKSFGLVAFHEKSLAGWCLSEYNHKNQCEVGIATMPPFKRKGLAKSMAQAFIQLAEKNGIERILWHCFESNEPSWRTALSAGFELFEQESVLMIYFDPALNYAIHGNLHFEKGDYKQSLAWYQKALVQKDPQAWMAWNGACAAAQSGEIDLAFDFLYRAIDLGFSDLDHLVQSEHMALLKEEERWGLVIAYLNQTIPSYPGSFPDS
jgi:RimJ/RimL family protein N-acetyltransferase